MSSEVEKKLSVKIEKTLENLKNELNTVRAGRANSALLDKIVVDYYSVPTPLISPFDTKTVADIEKAINMSNIGITPSNDGKSIRLMIPQLTEERRKEISKTVKKYGEDAKVALRNERRTANDELKKEEKDGIISEDDLKKELEKIQKVIDKASKDVEAIVALKEKEILEL